MSEADASITAAPSTTALLATPRRGRVRGVAALARPRQWMKNLLVVAAAGAAGALGRDDVLGRVLAAGAAFCLISAGIYALNDVRDHHEDRGHPRKRLRPVAAREVSPRVATLAGLVWLTAGLTVCLAISPWLLAAGAGYVVLTVSYSMVWRAVPVLELAALAGGFVLRALAGGAAGPTPLSIWFLLVVSFAAVFAATGKRLGELVRAVAFGDSMRRVLRRYSARGLRGVLVLSALGAICAYAAWVLSGPDPGDLPWRSLTFVPFVASLVRYGRLAARGAAETPEQLVFTDRLLACGVAVWIVLFGLSVDATV
jgi:decaprenyl-phosphate phosphoribosyltransferase